MRRWRRLPLRCWCGQICFPSRLASTTSSFTRRVLLLSEIVGRTVSPNKAVVGKNAFAHESGIHQHGVLSNPLTYEIMTPASVGVTANSIVLGKHSGRRALQHRLQELGYGLTGTELDGVYVRFTQLADRKKQIYDQDLVALLEHTTAVA